MYYLNYKIIEQEMNKTAIFIFRPCNAVFFLSNSYLCLSTHLSVYLFLSIYVCIYVCLIIYHTQMFKRIRKLLYFRMPSTCLRLMTSVFCFRRPSRIVLTDVRSSSSTASFPPTERLACEYHIIIPVASPPFYHTFESSKLYSQMLHFIYNNGYTDVTCGK